MKQWIEIRHTQKNMKYMYKYTKKVLEKKIVSHSKV